MFRRWTMVGDEVIHSREAAGASTVGGRPLVLVHGVGTTSRYFRARWSGGELDPIVSRRWARELVVTAPHARSSEIAGGGHACHHGRPRAVADLLVDAATDAPHALPSEAPSRAERRSMSSADADLSL